MYSVTIIRGSFELIKGHQIQKFEKKSDWFFRTNFWKKHLWTLTNSVKRYKSGMSESLHYFGLLFERLGVHRPLAHLFDRNFDTLVPNTFPNLRKKIKKWNPDSVVVKTFVWKTRFLTSPNMPFPRRWVSLISLWLISQTSLARPPVDWGSCICGHASPSLQLN